MTLGGPRIPDSEPLEFELTSVRAGEDPAVELKMTASDKRSFAVSISQKVEFVREVKKAFLLLLTRGMMSKSLLQIGHSHTHHSRLV